MHRKAKKAGDSSEIKMTGEGAERWKGRMGGDIKIDL